MLEIWRLNTNGLDNKSLRWIFLEEISIEFNWKDRSWAVIEVTKNGEIMRLVNYLIYYNDKGTDIIAYRYYQGKWVKIKAWQEHSKLTDLIKESDKVPVNDGRNAGDVVVTDFRSALPVQSVYYVENTLAQDSRIKSIISR